LNTRPSKLKWTVARSVSLTFSIFFAFTIAHSIRVGKFCSLDEAKQPEQLSKCVAAPRDQI
jgi:hypothetical protein